MNISLPILQFSYRDSIVLCKIISMYCYGPAYNKIGGKTLSTKEKEYAEKIKEKHDEMRGYIRNQYPDLYTSYPNYPPEALNKILELTVTEEEMSILLTIFDETLRESTLDNFYELEEIFVGPLEEIRSVYEILRKARRM